MDIGLQGKRALVMGGSKGLGRACATALSREGVAVTIFARNPETLAAAADEIGKSTGHPVEWVAGDFTSVAGRAAALARCPSPDILINNAEGMPPGDFHDWTREVWLRALDDMMLAPIELIRATVDGMIRRRFGRIINITSRSVKDPQAELGLSNGARTGLVGFCAGLARKTVAHNVTINNLLPGIFASGAQRNHVNGLVKMTGRPFEELWEERARGNPARRYGDPAEFGDLCAYLCSAQAGFITGQSILIDGGSYPGTF